jgi:hypothetical protein
MAAGYLWSWKKIEKIIEKKLRKSESFTDEDFRDINDVDPYSELRMLREIILEGPDTAF